MVIEIYVGVFFILFFATSFYHSVNRNKIEGSQTLFSTNSSKEQIIIGSGLTVLAISGYFFGHPLILIYLPMGIISIGEGLNKLRIGGNGIYINGTFFIWEEIEHFKWDPFKNNHLILKVKERRAFLGWRKNIRYRVNKGEQYQVDNLLKENLVKVLS